MQAMAAMQAAPGRISCTTGRSKPVRVQKGQHSMHASLKFSLKFKQPNLQADVRSMSQGARDLMHSCRAFAGARDAQEGRMIRVMSTAR